MLMPVSLSLSSLPMVDQLQGIMGTVGPLDFLDIILVSFILYKMYELLEDTRAITLVKGIGVLILLTIACSWFNLYVIYWILQKALTFLVVALPIVFQPELRRTLEHIGKGRFFGSSVMLDDEEARRIVNELDKAIMTISKNKIGALLIFERNMGLKDICNTGIQIDGLISSDFIINVFIPNTPLHDGAVVIRGKRLVAAGCILPLTDNPHLSTELGTRHRAGIGLSEQSDAMVFIVSEETGIISIAEGGHIRRNIDSARVKEELWQLFAPDNMKIKDIMANWRLKKK